MEKSTIYYEQKETLSYKAAYLTQPSPESPDGLNADHFIFNDRLGYFGVFDSAGYSKEAIDAGKISSLCFKQSLENLHFDNPFPKAEDVNNALISGWKSSIISIEHYSRMHQLEVSQKERWNPTTTAAVGQISYNFQNNTKTFETLYAGDSRVYILSKSGTYDKTPDEALIYGDLEQKKLSKKQAEQISELVDSADTMDKLLAFVDSEGTVLYPSTSGEMEELLYRGAVNIAHYVNNTKYLHNAISDPNYKRTIKPSPNLKSFPLDNAMGILIATDGLMGRLTDREMTDFIKVGLIFGREPSSILQDLFLYADRLAQKPNRPKRVKDDSTACLISLV